MGFQDTIFWTFSHDVAAKTSWKRDSFRIVEITLAGLFAHVDHCRVFWEATRKRLAQLFLRGYSVFPAVFGLQRSVLNEAWDRNLYADERVCRVTFRHRLHVDIISE